LRANSFPKNPAMVRVDSSRVDDEWLSMKEAEHQDEGEAEAAEATETKDPEAEANVHAEAEEDGEKDESVLDKTVLSDPLSDEEREVLTKLRQHETEVEKVRSAALELRSKASQSAVDFRSFTEAAQQVEDSTKVDPEILQRDAVSSQLEWPAKELKFARVLVAALDAWEKALAKGKEQLTAAPENAVIGESITALLESFQQMQVAQREAQASGSPAVRHADIGLTGKETGLRPLLEALLDKAQELEQLESFKAQLQDDEVRMQMLSDLKVQLPDSHVGKTEPLPLGTEDVPTAVEATDPVKQEEDEHLDPQKLWRAVHTGDESIVKAFVARKACDGTSRDASGHSIFWHAISFNHHSLAQYFWESFPPGSAGGIEVDEVHYRKGDTLLHLLCLCRPFNAEAAALFKRVAAKAPPPVFQKQNALGLTFLDIAIDTLNFWVLTFVLKNFQVPAKALLCNSRAPLRRLFKVLRPPMAPQAYQAPGPFPEHFRVAAMLQQDPSGLVPYADVAFDVGPERQGVATGRFLAHRVVVVAQSPVLFEVLEKMPLTELPKEKISAALIRVDERISQEVWRSVLQFMYQGTISVEHCSYLKDAGKCVELLRACLLYKLPEPLLRLALSHLFRLLPSSSPTHALQVFALCASDEHIKNKELSSVRDGAAWVLLHQAHIMFVDIEAPDLCEILSKVVRCLESTVFENPDQPAVMEDLLSYSFHGVPQDILSQTLSTTRRVSAHFQTKEDMLSQSMASVSSMQSWPNQRGASRVVMY